MSHPLANRRRLALAGLALSIALLLPGLVLPVITLRGTLDPQGVATLAPRLLEEGLSDDVVGALRFMLNPALLPMLDASPGGLKGALVTQLGGQLGQQLASGPEIEVYQQTRSIVGSVRHLYRVGSSTAATLILLFSIIVPFTKVALVMWALFHRDGVRRKHTLHFVEVIAKWAMADVFAVALFIAYLAARASQTPPGAGVAPQVVAFTATFGPGFYWFAAYCLVSLGVQQATARWIMADEHRAGGLASQ
ncbi:MAG: paraquat-inducible protein A [Gemmatimonadota bacterium]|nr:paraquat-inducible protein A [Gemmatimonadota bacterium]MDH4349981.1 paraquat-inducible protein A [Gemmatimonadota bacterium]MDH5196684.1 paraquat-inducible protein A [Gemmatimonadota bacterium]